MEKYPSPVEGTGLENQEVGNGAGVRIPLSPPINFIFIAGWSSSVARWAHNPEVVGSNPTPENMVPSTSGLSQWVFSPPFGGSNPLGTTYTKFNN